MRFAHIALVAALASVALVLGLGGARGALPTTPYASGIKGSPDPQLKGRWAERTATAGDLNGDGVNDLFVGDPMEDVGGVTDAGRVYAVSGKTLQVLFTIDSPEPQAGAKFGFFISVVGDVNADGKADLAVGTDAQDVYTGSGTPCGAPEPNGCNEGQGKAWVFSGANGKLLYALGNPAPQGSAKNHARFGSRIGRAGDVNGDGRPDVIVGASGNDVPAGCGDRNPLPAGCRIDQGQAFIFSGATGKLIRTLDLPTGDEQPAGTCASSCGGFGFAVQSPGDTNGDNVPDQLVDAGSYSFYTGSGAPCGTPEPNGCNEGQGRMYLFSGKTGKLLLRIDDPTPQAGAFFGFQDAAPLSPGDVNHDGHADLYANGFLQDGASGPGEGRGWVFNGKTGALLYTLTDPTPEAGGQFGWSMATTDYNKDGTPDLYVGASPHHIPGATGSGGTDIFNGKNGSLLKALELPAPNVQRSTSGDLGPNLGWTVSAPGDLNGDGQPDYVAGAPFEDVGSNQDQGMLFVFDSHDRTAPSAPAIRGPRSTRSRKPVYLFSARDADNRPAELGYRCSYGSPLLHRCRARSQPVLRPGKHVLRVEAVDLAGNRSRVTRITIVVRPTKH